MLTTTSGLVGVESNVIKEKSSRWSQGKGLIYYNKHKERLTSSMNDMKITGNK